MALSEQVDPLYLQAGRFHRKHWGSHDVQALADEIFLALLQARGNPNLGPVTIDFGDGRAPATLRPENLRDPSGTFRLPDLEFPELQTSGYGNPDRDNIGHQLNITQYVLTDDQQPDPTSPEGLHQPTRFVRTSTQIFPSRTVVPGKIISGSGDTYTVTLYPNGPENKSFNQDNVKQLQIHPSAKLPAGTWCFVWRYIEAEVVTQTVIETNPGTGGEREVSKVMKIKLGVKSSHWMQVAVWI